MLVLSQHSVNYLHRLWEKPFAQLVGLDVARDDHFCGKSGMQIGGNDHWPPVGLEGRRDREKSSLQRSNSRIVWRAWWSSLTANVERGWVQPTTWTTNDAWFITSPSRRPVRSRYSQDANKSTYIRKSEEEAWRAAGPGWVPVVVRIDCNWYSRGKESDCLLYPWESLTFVRVDDEFVTRFNRYASKEFDWISRYSFLCIIIW